MAVSKASGVSGCTVQFERVYQQCLCHSGANHLDTIISHNSK